MDHMEIPLSDGTVLSARMWIADNAAESPVPAVVEYVPFRYRDFSAPRDSLIHPWFAGHGYASIRWEPRGSQESSGAPMDEYIKQEQDDALEALEWIASQPWCSGSTGMFGMSWGAFSALQVAARRPPSLKAIIPVHGTDDRFDDDIHFKGGCLLTANLAWGWLYTHYMMRPPDPSIVGDSWQDTWIERIQKAPFVLKNWVGEQTKNAYWKHGSVRENYSQITAATYVFCGWADGYSNAAIRMAQNLKSPNKICIGPWAHTYPHIALPGPQIGFLQEAVRWWDRWLKNINNGIDDEERIHYWMQGSVPPAPSYSMRPGRWIGSNHWPPVHVSNWTFYLNKGGMGATANQTVDKNHVLEISSPLASGMTGGEWLPHGVGPEMPLDQRYEDVGAVCFLTSELADTLEICGSPTVTLKIKSNQPKGSLVLRLSDVARNGESTQITYGLLNLTHHTGSDQPRLLNVNSWCTVTVALNAVAQQIPRGHKIRLSVSTESYQLIWPVFPKTTLVLQTGISYLDLPIRSVENGTDSLFTFPRAAIPEPTAVTWLRPVKRRRTITHETTSGLITRSYLKDDGAYRINENNMELDTKGTLTYSCVNDDPLSAKAELSFRIQHSKGDWNACLEGNLVVSATSHNIQFLGQITASSDEQKVAIRHFDEVVKRAFI